MPFLSVAGSEFQEVFVGVGAARVRGMFEKARSMAPCILFIDEFDGMAKKRSSANQNPMGQQDGAPAWVVAISTLPWCSLSCLGLPACVPWLRTRVPSLSVCRSVLGCWEQARCCVLCCISGLICTSCWAVRGCQPSAPLAAAVTASPDWACQR